MKYVLVWSCGPVQDFIAAARKGRDLWFGSWLLSEIAKAAAAAVVEETGGVEALVMPAPERPEALDEPTFNASNKILVRAEGEPGALAEAMSEAARARLVEIAEAAFKRAHSSVDLKSARAQLADLLETYWAAADEGVSGGFAPARNMAEILHAARKGDRPFAQPSWGGPVPKSSLDGARESVIPESAFDELKENPETLRERYGAGPAERLCGVALVKRFGHCAAGRASRGARIQSTSHVASWSTRRALEPELHREAFETYRSALEALGADLTRHPGAPDPVTGRVDGHVLYPARLGDFVPTVNLAAAERALDALFRTWRERSREAGRPAPPRPTPYFAVLVADGDALGALLDELKEPGQHRQVTQQLDAFAARAERLIGRGAFGGQAVFTGGDDVLALLPARTALDCASALARDFAQLSLGGRSTTLSAGICIGHHLDPLHRTLDAARRAEQFAKQEVGLEAERTGGPRAGRNAWAITLAKRGGSPLTLGGRWEELPLLESLIELYERRGDRGGETLPRGLPYDLRVAHERLDGRKASGERAALLSGLRVLEGRRLLIQKNLRRADEEPAPGTPAAVLEAQFAGGDLRGVSARLELARALTAFDGGAA